MQRNNGVECGRIQFEEEEEEEGNGRPSGQQRISSFLPTSWINKTIHDFNILVVDRLQGTSCHMTQIQIQSLKARRGWDFAS